MKKIEQIRALIKEKGTGKTMSRPLSAQDLDAFKTLLQDPEIPLASSATLITALIMLDGSPEEDAFIKQLSQDMRLIPAPLQFIFSKSANFNDFLISIPVILSSLIWIASLHKLLLPDPPSPTSVQ